MKRKFIGCVGDEKESISVSTKSSPSQFTISSPEFIDFRVLVRANKHHSYIKQVSDELLLCVFNLMDPFYRTTTGNYSAFMLNSFGVPAIGHIEVYARTSTRFLCRAPV